MVETQALHVLMNGRRVGQLSQWANGAMRFQYGDEWLALPRARPISLSLPLRHQAYEGAIVYNFFDNLLPERDSIRARLQARFQIPTRQPFDLLSAIGADCVGAIQLCSEEILNDVKVTHAVPLSNPEIANLLNGYRTAPLGMSPNSDEFRISIAGAQEKTALLWHHNQWCRPLGSTATSHIFKLPIGRLEKHGMDLSDSCENEWLCLKIASAFGLPVAIAEIHQFEAMKALVVERFDRRWSQDGTWLMRLPQEDMCQALGISPGLKYQSDGGPGIADIMTVLLGSEDVTGDRECFIRSQILFWLLGAIDGHGKNFSLYLQAGGSYRLTPLYDIISAYPLMANGSIPTQKAKMAMALRGKKNYYLWSVIQPRHFISTATQVGFSSQRVEVMIREMLTQVHSVIEQVTQILPDDFPQATSEPIFAGMKAIADLHLQSNTP